MNLFKRLGEGWVAVHALVCFSSLLFSWWLTRWLIWRPRFGLLLRGRPVTRYASLLCRGLLLAMALPAWSAPFVIVGTPEALFRMETSQGIQGIDVEVVTQVMDQLEIPYEIQLITSGARIIREAEQGNIDMVMSFSHKQARTAYLDYP